MALKSPYFKKKRKRVTSSPSSILCSSDGGRSSYLNGQRSYFLGSTLAVHRCVAQLGPLILSLSDRESACFPCQRSESSCSCSSAIINDALSHFYYSCEIFRSAYESYHQHTKGNYDSASCLEKANVRILYSARHLCPHRCYLRAFSPVREWLLLHKSVNEKTDHSLVGMCDCCWKKFFVLDFSNKTIRRQILLLDSLLVLICC